MRRYRRGGLGRRARSQAELEGDMGDPQWSASALMSQALRKLTAIVSKSRTCLIFINKSRKDRRDVRQPGDYTGGRALEVYA